MKEMIIGADLLPEASTDKALKFQGKDSGNQRLPKIRFEEFSDYLCGTIGASLSGFGQEHTYLNRLAEARFIKFFCRYTTGFEGDAIEHFCYADTGFSLYVWNGRFYERLTAKEFGLFIREVLIRIEVGDVYQIRSSEAIAREIISTLLYMGLEWKPDNRYFVFSNGVLNIDTMELSPHNKGVKTNLVFDFEYEPNAKCDKFLKVVKFALDKPTEKVLQELFGYLLFSDARHQKIGVLLGNGRNGKSVILEAVSYALGEDRVTHFDLMRLTDPAATVIPHIVGKIANLSYDSGNIMKAGSEAILKQYAAGEPILCKVMRENPTNTTNYPRSIVAVNELPISADKSSGYFRRFLIIEFPKQVPDKDVNPMLKEELKEERMGILLWIIAGMKRLLSQGGFTESRAVDDVLKRYRKENDAVATFLDECDFRKSQTETIPLSNLYATWEKWRTENGYKSMNSRTFGARLRGLGLDVRKIGGVSKVYLESNADLPA